MGKEFLATIVNPNKPLSEKYDALVRLFEEINDFAALEGDAVAGDDLVKKGVELISQYCSNYTVSELATLQQTLEAINLEKLLTAKSLDLYGIESYSLTTAHQAITQSINEISAATQKRAEQEHVRSLENTLALSSGSLAQAVEKIDLYLAILKKVRNRVDNGSSQIETNLQQARDALLEQGKAPSDNITAFFKALQIPYDSTQDITAQIEAAITQCHNEVKQNTAMCMIASYAGEPISSAFVAEILENISLIATDKSQVDSATTELLEQGERYIEAFTRNPEEFKPDSLSSGLADAIFKFFEAVGHPADPPREEPEKPYQKKARVENTLKRIMITIQVASALEKGQNPVSDMLSHCQTYLHHLESIKNPDQKTKSRTTIVKAAARILQNDELSGAQKILNFQSHIEKNSEVLSKTTDSPGKLFINKVVDGLRSWGISFQWLDKLQKTVNATSDTQDFRDRLAKTKQSIDTQQPGKENDPDADNQEPDATDNNPPLKSDLSVMPKAYLSIHAKRL